jgi:hypothetical protein
MAAMAVSLLTPSTHAEPRSVRVTVSPLSIDGRLVVVASLFFPSPLHNLTFTGANEK